MTRSSVAPVLLAIALMASACASSAVTSAAPAGQSYDGPLYLTRSAATHPEAGAAGDVVDCGTWGAGGFSDTDVYGEGATADSPEKALAVGRGEGLFSGVQQGLSVAKEEEDRVLYVVEVDGVVKQAVIVHNGPATDGAGGPGWYVESWAVCDYSELPQAFTDSIGLQIWTNASGEPVPTTKIQAWRGPEHCDWESMTFLSVGTVVYVRDPQPDLSEFFADAYRSHADLPRDAVDTGYEHDGRHLWLSSDEKLAFVGTQDDVEVWPRTIKQLACD
jgi:hypothetical protein